MQQRATKATMVIIKYLQNTLNATNTLKNKKIKEKSQ